MTGSLDRFLERDGAGKLIANFEAGKARYDKMVVLVEEMLELNKRKHVAPPSRRQGVRQDAGATTDLEREIIEGL